MLEQFQEFGVSFIIEDVEDYGQYGLDDPVCTIKLETGDESYEILLGDFSKMTSAIRKYIPPSLAASTRSISPLKVSTTPLLQMERAITEPIIIRRKSWKSLL
ncbi:MAG: DUF4340 domain-containing protein [Clostridiales bacterium]|nr:DUF4340 domain-containing protein [Clostridiales bacterium]